MKKHFKLLLSTDSPDQGKYTNIKNLIMKCIKRYLKMNNPSKSITKDIADCLSIIILSGVFYHWTNVISDLIQESYNNSNLTLYYLVLLALADIDILIHYNKTEEESYSNPLIISNGERMKIKDKLFNNSEIVMKYIIFIFKGIKDFSGDENKKNLFINALLDCIRCWSNFKLNILKHLDLAKIAYYIMNNFLIENPNKFSYLVMECISNSDNSKVYQSIDTDKNSTPEQLSEIIFKSINNDEKKGLDLLLEFLSPNLEYFKRINPEEIPENKKKLFIAYMRILSAIMENYIYFFFNFSDERSGKMLEYFQYFLMYKKRIISSFFIEGLGEMRNFINNFYRFSGLNEEQKSNFANYFMNIFLGVLVNCSYKNLNLNNTDLLDKEILNGNNLTLEKNSNCFDNSGSKNNLDEYDTDFIEEMMSVEYYRDIAKDVFYNIFFIFVINFGDEASAYILEKKILEKLYVTNANDLNDPNYPLIVDVIFFSLYPISEVFEYVDNSEENDGVNLLKCSTIIKNVINYFIESKIVLENCRILIDFMVLINKYYFLIGKDANIFFKVIKFLLNISKIANNANNEKIEQSCYIMLSNICHAKSDNIPDDLSLINEIFNLFNSKYSNYDYKKISSLKEIIGILLSLLGIKRRNPKDILPQDKKDLYKDITQKIVLPINSKVKEIIEKYEHNNLNDKNIQEILISEINKSYIIQEQIISSLEEFNLEIKNYFIQQYLNKFLFLTINIIQLFYDNEVVMRNIFDFFNKISKTIGENFDNNLENVTNVFIELLNSDKGKNNFRCILILKDIYLSLIQYSEKNGQLYTVYNKYVLEKYYVIVNNFMEKILKSDLKNKNIKEKLKVLFEFHSDIFPKLSIDQDEKINKLIENLIIFLIKCIELLRTLENEIEITEERVISLLIKSFIEIFKNKSFINNNNENYINNCINNIVSSLWGTIQFKQFNSLSRTYLINFCIMALKYDVDNFCQIFRTIISNLKDIKNIEEIIEYLRIFKDDNSNIKSMMLYLIENNKGNADKEKLRFLLSLASREKIKMKSKKGN